MAFIILQIIFKTLQSIFSYSNFYLMFHLLFLTLFYFWFRLNYTLFFQRDWFLRKRELFYFRLNRLNISWLMRTIFLSILIICCFLSLYFLWLFLRINCIFISLGFIFYFSCNRLRSLLNCFWWVRLVGLFYSFCLVRKIIFLYNFRDITCCFSFNKIILIRFFSWKYWVHLLISLLRKLLCFILTIFYFIFFIFCHLTSLQRFFLIITVLLETLIILRL
jgi:hypothetical protein